MLTETVAGVVTNTTARIGNQSVPVQSIVSWIIWMRRVGTAFNWTLPWVSYQNGIGSIGDGNYWLGLESLYQLTNSFKYRLRIEMKVQSTQKWISVEYWSFSVGSNTNKYQLRVDG
jgi:Fibrinogen beta and gamma chains, C-terminal globular domain